MAGKHVGIPSAGFSNPGLPSEQLIWPPVYPGTRMDRAYAEGRRGVPASNPHPAGTPENNAYTLGAFYANQSTAKVQTGVPV